MNNALAGFSVLSFIFVIDFIQSKISKKSYLKNFTRGVIEQRTIGRIDFGSGIDVPIGLTLSSIPLIYLIQLVWDKTAQASSIEFVFLYLLYPVYRLILNTEERKSYVKYSLVIKTIEEIIIDSMLVLILINVSVLQEGRGLYLTELNSMGELGLEVFLIIIALLCSVFKFIHLENKFKSANKFVIKRCGIVLSNLIHGLSLSVFAGLLISNIFILKVRFETWTETLIKVLFIIACSTVLLVFSRQFKSWSIQIARKDRAGVILNAFSMVLIASLIVNYIGGRWAI